MSRRAFMVGLGVIALLIFSLYRAKYGAADSAERIADIEAEIERAIDERQILLGELSTLSREDWVEDYARNELGMVTPRAEQFVRADDLPHIFDAVDDAREISVAEGGSQGVRHD